MKAVRVHSYGGVDQLRYEDAPIPQPGTDQVLVKVHAAGVNPFDHKLASGAFAKFVPLTLPYIPGADVSGVVEKLGAGVKEFKVGDAVYGNSQPTGAYAQFVAAPADTVAPKPKSLDHTSAASVPTGAQTAWQALFDLGHLDRGQTVLIHAAAGGVGGFAVQLAHWKGAKVIATASGKNVDYVRSLGADQVVDYKTTQFEDVSRDVDVVLDLLGGETQARSFQVVKRGGRLISTVQPPPQDAAKARDIHAEMVQMRASSDNLKEIAKLIDAGAIKAPAVQRFPLEKVAEAWTQILSGHMQGKIVLVVQKPFQNLIIPDSCCFLGEIEFP
jgi:NADPH:quinone reductase-like Zn-dependent oxidoreductase